MKETTDSGIQHFCMLEGNICNAFVINDEPSGAYKKGYWKADLNFGESPVIHTLVVDKSMKDCGIASRMV